MPNESTEKQEKEKIQKIKTPDSVKSLGHKKKMIFGILLIMVGVGMVAVVAYPMYNKYKETKLVLAGKQQELSDLNLRVDQLKKVERLVSTIEKNTELTKQAVPENTDIPVGMGTVQEIAESSGVRIASFSYAGEALSALAAPANTPANGTPATNKEFDSYKMNIVVRGRYDNLKTFLENLEQSRRIFDASNFSYTTEKGDTEVVSSVFSLRLLINAYKKEFSPSAIEINLDQYTDVISQLEAMKYYEVNLDTQIGKQDPFSQESNGGGTSLGDEEVDVNVIELETGATATDGSSFFNPTPSSTNINEQQNSSNPQNTTGAEVVEDVEAPEGDTLKVLQQLLQQEGVEVDQ